MKKGKIKPVSNNLILTCTDKRETAKFQDIEISDIYLLTGKGWSIIINFVKNISLKKRSLENERIHREGL